MIKAQAKLVGTVHNSGTMRQSRDGKQYLSFSVKVSIPGSRPEHSAKETLIYVSFGDISQPEAYVFGTRVECNGTLTFKKKGEALYLNFAAESVTLGVDAPDELSGTLEFRGTVGKTITAKTTAKGKPFLSFSGYSAEKVGNDFAYTWVHFLQFDAVKPEWLEPKAKIRVIGKLDLTAYNDSLSLGCRIETLEQRQKLPFPPPTNAPTPF